MRPFVAGGPLFLARVLAGIVAGLLAAPRATAAEDPFRSAGRAPGAKPAPAAAPIAAAAPERSADEHYRLALWCQRRGHAETMREQARLAVERDPEHEGARALLGHRRVGQRWLPTDRQELALYVERLQDEVNARFQQLVDDDAAEREEARRAIALLAEREELPELAHYADALAKKLDELLPALRAQPRRGNALLELRLGSAKVTALREKSVSTGVGNPVTLQLPEVSGVSVGTTVVVPWGG